MGLTGAASEQMCQQHPNQPCTHNHAGCTHNHDCRLLAQLPAKAGEAAQKWLESKGVQVLLGQRVVDLEQASS